MCWFGFIQSALPQSGQCEECVAILYQHYRLQVPTVINGDAISEVGYVLGTSADNFRSAYLEAAFVEQLVSLLRNWLTLKQSVC